MDLLNKALNFAKVAHGTQKRKYTGEPYIVHPIAVMEMVRGVEHTKDMLAAALLHDVVEDTPVTIDDIKQEFGNGIAELVGWLTDVSRPEDGNRAIRKEIDRKHLAEAPEAAQTIKLADLIDNTASIVEYAPGFARVYLKEKRSLLEVLKKGNQVLWVTAKQLLVSSEKKLQLT